MFAILLLSAAAPLSSSWAHFERTGELNRVTEIVEIATDGSDPVTHQIALKLRYTRSALQDDATRWTNSRQCSAISRVLASMRDIEMPKPAPYGIPGEVGIAFVDGTTYSLTAPSSFPNGKLTITSNVGSPLATWVDRAFKTLEPCWMAVESRVR